MPREHGRGNPRWPRRLLIAGFVAMVVGALDPLEGSVVILLGSALAALGARLGQSRDLAMLYGSVVLTAVGVGAMWSLSAVGGFGGSTGRTNWWWLALAPYPVGWVLGLVGVVRTLRASRPGPKARADRHFRTAVRPDRRDTGN
jgi:hypothetical protein